MVPGRARRHVAVERDPVILKVANSWIILNAGGGPTEDTPGVVLETPSAPDRVGVHWGYAQGQCVPSR